MTEVFYRKWRPKKLDEVVGQYQPDLPPEGHMLTQVVEQDGRVMVVMLSHSPLIMPNEGSVV